MGKNYVDRCRRYSWRLDLAAPKLAAAGSGRSTPEHMGRRGEGDVVSIFFRFGYPQARGTRACGEAGPREGRCRETVLPAKGRACRRAGERFLSSKQKERNEKVMAEDGLWLS
uniref:Uncharacterized protein n=1 Tax=Oryza nivara TaxID=4536 RepID=A0A0E0GA91_ORYNI